MSGLNPDAAVSKFTKVLPESPGGRLMETLSQGLNVAVPGIRVQAEARQPRALLADTPGPPSREKPALCIFLVKLFLQEMAVLRGRQPHQVADHHKPRRGSGAWTAGSPVAVPGDAWGRDVDAAALPGALVAEVRSRPGPRPPGPPHALD